MPELEREILRAYVDSYGSKKEAATALGMALRTFHAKAKRYGLQKGRGGSAARDAGGASQGTRPEREVQNQQPPDSSEATASAKPASLVGPPR
jgi:hypothetical protein